jgi:membrane protein
MRYFLSILREAFFRSISDGCFSIAKGAAYSLILTFFPTMLVLAWLLAGSRTTAALMREITHGLGRVLPPTVSQSALQFFASDPQRPMQLIIISALIGLLAATGVMSSFMQGFRAAYRIRTQWSFWKEELVATALVFLVGTPMLAATALVVFGTQVQSWLVDELGAPALVSAAWAAMRWVVAIVTGTVVLSIIYYVGPNREERFHWVFPGALLATLAWVGTTAGFGWYVQNVAQYTGIYGSLGTAIALLVWMYLLAAIVMLGAQFNAVHERRRRGM